MVHGLAPPLRLLRHTPGTLTGLALNANHRFATTYALVHYASGAIFTFIPKNACTSLRVSLALANGAIADKKDWAWVHNNNGTFSAGLPDLARATSTAVILRCPFARIASTFLDKIVTRREELWRLHNLLADRLDPDRLTFRSFVELVTRPDLLRADVHWRPQADFLIYAGYDTVFGMRDMAGFATHFESITGRVFVDARELPENARVTVPLAPGVSHADTPLSVLTPEKSQGRVPDAKDLYDDALVARVRQAYATDLNLYLKWVGRAGLLFDDAATEGPR